MFGNISFASGNEGGAAGNNDEERPLFAAGARRPNRIPSSNFLISSDSNVGAESVSSGYSYGSDGNGSSPRHTPCGSPTTTFFKFAGDEIARKRAKRDEENRRKKTVVAAAAGLGIFFFAILFARGRHSNNGDENDKSLSGEEQMMMKEVMSEGPALHNLEPKPTFLSLLDVENDELLNAYSNPLYGHYLASKVLDDYADEHSLDGGDYVVEEFPKLTLNRDAIESLEDRSLVMTWTPGSLRRYDGGNVEAAFQNERRENSSVRRGQLPLVKKDDVFVLSCTRTDGDRDDEEEETTSSTTATQVLRERLFREGNIHEVGTVEQVQRTTLAVKENREVTGEYYAFATTTGNEMDGNKSLASPSASQDEQDEEVEQQYPNEWYIPEFPVLRDEDVCHFRLYSRRSQQQQPPAEVEEEREGEAKHTHTHHRDEFVLIGESDLFYMMESIRNTPTLIHLAIGDDNESEMVVNFVTGQPGTPVATYGVAEHLEGQAKVSGTSTTYEAKDMCQAPANRTEPGKFQSPGQLHTVVLKDLIPSTRYQYKVGLSTGQGIVWSKTFTFLSSPRSASSSDDGASPEPYTYLFYGDQGCPTKGWGYGSMWTTNMVNRELRDGSSSIPVRAVHHVGDLSYAQGVAHQWEEWFQMIEKFTTSVPLMITVGNHEYDHMSGGAGGKDPSGVTEDHGYMPKWGNYFDDSGGECGVPVSKRFKMPGRRQDQPRKHDSNGVFWYSYDYGMVHTTVLSTEHELNRSSRQYQWLSEDFASVNRTKTPWLVVEMHRPLYEAQQNNFDNNNIGIAMRYNVEDLFHDYGVDVVLTGHYHSYYRTCDGLYRDVCDRGGPTHVTVGTAGAQLLAGVGLYDNPWTAKLINDEFGYARVTVHNESSLHLSFVSSGDPANNDTNAGQVLDDVWITRQRG